MGAVVVDDGCLLMVRRSHAPWAGAWSIPGGRVEAGETLAHAVVRETREETGLACVCGALLGWAEIIEETAHYIILDFEATLLDRGDPVPASDASEALWVPLADVCELRLPDGLAEFLSEHHVIPTLA